MRRRAVIGAILAVALGVPAVAGADPTVPDANLVKAQRGIRADARTVNAAGRTIDLAKAILPLEEEAIDEGRVTVRLSADVLFEFDKAALTETAKRRIGELAERLRQAEGVVRVSGHSDSIGDNAYNLRLSRTRATAVKAELDRALGDANVRIEASGFGETKPIEPNEVNGKDNPAGRAKNRRVEITFQE